MVHLRISDADGEIEVRQHDDSTTNWGRPGWRDDLVVTVIRRPDHKLLIQIRRKGDTNQPPRFKKAILEKGQSIVLKTGVDLPSDFLRGRGTAITFTDDE